MKYSSPFSIGFKRTLRFLTLIYLGVFAMTLSAQDESENSEQEINNDILRYVDFTLNFGLPINTFNDKFNGSTFGFTLAYTKQRKLGQMNFIGAQFSYAHLGSITTPFNQFDIRTGTNWMNLQFLYRHFQFLFLED